MSEQQARWHWLMGSRGLDACYQQCLGLCRPGDALLLMGQHIYLVLDQCLQSAPEGIKIFALKESVAMSGLIGQAPPHVELIDWEQVLDLLESDYPLQQTWV